MTISEKKNYIVENKMLEIEKINAYLEERLSEKRYTHSLGVAQEAVKLAKRYGADAEKAYLAGLVHDVAKEIPYEAALDMLAEYGATVDEVTKSTHKLLHGPLGTYMIQSEFDITDAEIIDAVLYHTTAKADMSILTKIIYMADYIEPNRSFDGVNELRELAYKDLDEAIMVGLDYTICELVEKGSAFHIDTVNARNWLLLR